MMYALTPKLLGVKAYISKFLKLVFQVKYNTLVRKQTAVPRYSYIIAITVMLDIHIFKVVHTSKKTNSSAKISRYHSNSCSCCALM